MATSPCDAVKTGGAAVGDPSGTITGGSFGLQDPDDATEVGALFCDGPSIPNP